jgi:protein involved in ribonucleotide reduction
MSELAKINGYDIRDRKLADTGTKTTAVNTDYVLLEDTSGNYQKIAKNSFTEAVRNTLGDILRNNDKGTSINGVPALGSDNDFGSISTANLASVLGEPLGIILGVYGCWGYTSNGEFLTKD